MSAINSPVIRALNTINKMALWISSIGLVLMTIFIAYQVFSRYVLNDSPSWTEAVATMLMTWFIFLGAAVGVRERYHLGFDVLLLAANDHVRFIMRTISDLVVLAFGAGMIIYGMQLVLRTWDATIPILNIPGGFTYIPIVAGGVLTCLFTLERLAMRFSGVDPDQELAEDELNIEMAKV
jgi:TRAP-type C4-dicarboxylate transport system permease small subunit